MLLMKINNKIGGNQRSLCGRGKGGWEEEWALPLTLFGLEA